MLWGDAKLRGDFRGLAPVLQRLLCRQPKLLAQLVGHLQILPAHTVHASPYSHS
eukprot:COSAG01_NODE_39640_length_473_cov_55.221925_1_plen_53_part_10